MKLEDSLFRRVYDALLDAFDEAELRIMLQLYLGRDLYRITSGNQFRERVISLIRWAERTERVTKLVESAHTYNPDNRLLQRVKLEVDHFGEVVDPLLSNNEPVISDYITRSEPFGPIDSGEIKGVEMRERLFDRHNLLFRYLQDRPSIIMGRKGSGKTAYLNSVYFYGKYDHIVELGTSSALQKVVEAVQSCTEGIAFAETVAELWGQFLWVGVLVGLREKITTAEVGEAVEAYLTELHIADSQSFDEALRDMLRFFQARAGELDIHQIIAMIERPGTALNNPVRLSTTRGLVEDWLRAQGQQVVVLMDSLDDFRLDIASVSHALQGLLKCIGQFNDANAVIDIRFCLPSELYHRFLGLSSNPNKDFRRNLILHWTAAELILMSAQRLAIFLQHYEPETYHRMQGCRCWMERAQATALFAAVLPPTIDAGRHGRSRAFPIFSATRSCCRVTC